MHECTYCNTYMCNMHVACFPKSHHCGAFALRCGQYCQLPLCCVRKEAHELCKIWPNIHIVDHKDWNVAMSCPPLSSAGGSASASSAASASVPVAQTSPPAAPPVAPASLSIQALPVAAVAASAVHDFPMDGLPLQYCRELIDTNGGEAAFRNLTTDDVKERYIVSLKKVNKAVA